MCLTLLIFTYLTRNRAIT
ncbi:hypothetical protein [Escherichia coli]|nr:hypothetical protein [Escherichia coli]